MLREALTLDRLCAMAPDEAAALFITRREEGLTESEQRLLASWLDENAAHARAFDQADRSWHSFDAADGDEILAAMRAHALAAERPRREPWSRALAAAAVLVLVVAASVLLMPGLRDALIGPDTDTISWTHYASPYGQTRTIALADGSTMTLDADSAADTRFGDRERALRLVKGRALFEVAKDPAKPFAVAAGSRRIVALGTRFEVGLNGGALRVTLFRGKVAVEPLQAGGKTVTLLPGQQFLERGGTVTVRSTSVGSDTQPAWRSGLIDLDNMPLGEAVAEVNRYSRGQIVVRDPAVAAMRVSGQFRAGDADRFAETIAELYPVKAVRRAGTTEIVPAR